MRRSDVTTTTWRRSSRSDNSGSGGNCVEVAFPGQAAAVRDSKAPAAGALGFPAVAWRSFLRTL